MAELRDGRGHRGQRLARACPSSPSPCSPGWCRSRASTTRRPRWTAPSSWGRFWHVTLPAAQAGARGGHPLLHDLHLRRLQHRLGAHARRPGQHHPPLRHPRLPGGAQRAATSARARPSRSSCSRCWPRWSSSSSATSGRSDRGHRPVRSRGARLRSAAFALREPASRSSSSRCSRSTSCSSRRSSRTPSCTTSSRSRSGSRRGVITDHYRYLFFKTEFFTWMKNSLIISVVATAVSLVDLDPRRLQPGPAALPRRGLLRHRRLHHLPGARRPCSSCRSRRWWCGSASPTRSGR